MKILLVGSGGREHALAWQLAQSEKCRELYCAPGNVGMEECADLVDIDAEDIEALVSFAKDKAIDLVVVAPEAPLVAGLVDRLSDEGIKAFGPTAAAAQLEGSKGFMKDLCIKYDIPTAAYGHFTDLAEAKSFIAGQSFPVVVKVDGLAAGKGVIICERREEAEKAAEEMLTGEVFGEAGQSIIIEEFLDGEELSFFALSDGTTIVPLTSAQDHKRVGEGDTGLNTGGMGAYSPACMMTEELGQKINDRIIRPTIDAMAKEGCPFSGVLFAGIMLVKGEPVLLEFNTRFGDPECQVLMMRMYCDLADVLFACTEARLSEVADQIFWRNELALCVVMAAAGYPGKYKTGTVIKDVRDADIMPYTKVFYAGAMYDKTGSLVNSGGRVLGITSLGTTVEEAREHAYNSVGKLDWPEGFCRKDIGWKALPSELTKSVA